MEWVNIVISAVIGIAGAFGGGSIIFARQTRKMKEIENEAKQSDEWRKLYEEMKGEVKERDVKIDELYIQINNHRDVEITLQKKITQLEVSNTKLQLTHCQVKGCVNREPPSGY